MKVCTDACLLGAYTAALLNDVEIKPNYILDIGTGTGLLALMLAQKSDAKIDAIEMNEAAAAQAKENFLQSLWAQNIHLINSSIQQLVTTKKYALIISNPPFFEDDLRSDNAQKNDAKHDTSLTLQELLNAIHKYLSDDGFASILLPYHRTNYFKEISEKAGLFIHKILKVKQSPQHTFFRSIIVLSKQNGNIKEDTIIINDGQRGYSPEFTALLKDYYLKL